MNSFIFIAEMQLTLSKFSMYFMQINFMDSFLSMKLY